MKDIDLQGILEFDAAPAEVQPDAAPAEVQPDGIDRTQLAKVKSLGRGVDSSLGDINIALVDKAINIVLGGKQALPASLGRHLKPLLAQLKNVINAGMTQRFFQLDKQAIASQESIEEGECTCDCGQPICGSCGKSHATESVDVEDILEGIDDIFLSENEISVGILNQFLGPKDGNLVRQALAHMEKGEGVPPNMVKSLLKYVDVVTQFLAQGAQGLSRLRSTSKSFLGKNDPTNPNRDEPELDAEPELGAEPEPESELEPDADDDRNVVDFRKKDDDEDEEEASGDSKKRLAASKYEEIERIKKLAGLSEAMSDAYGSVAEKDSSEKVSYEKVHQDGDNNLTIQASANSMDALHDMLKLAGVDIETNNAEEPEKPEDSENGEEPEVVVVGEPEPESDADVEPNDVKGILINKLKDQLATKLNS